MARVSIAYLFWALGGFFGLHHIYLGRLTHAIFFASTLGFCGLGFLYDFFYIPEYVKQANSDHIYLGLLRKRMKTRPTPSLSRLLAIYVASYIFSHLSLALLGFFEPIEARIGSNIQHLSLWWVVLSSLIQTIGILIGCLLVSSIGGQRTVSRDYLYLPILLGTIADIIIAHVVQARMLIICRAIFPTLFYARSCEWLPTCADPKPRASINFIGFSQQFLKYIFFSTLIFIFFLGSSFFYTEVLVTDNGEIHYSDSNYGLNFNIQSSFILSTYKMFNPTLESTPPDLITNTYNYTIFESELLQFYHNYTRPTSKTSSTSPMKTTSNLSSLTIMNQLTIPHSYRLRDVFRNIALSHIFSSSITDQPLQLYHYDRIPTTSDLFISSLISSFQRSFSTIYEAFLYIHLNGATNFIASLDVQGEQWAQNHFALLSRTSNNQPFESLNDIATLAVETMISTLHSTQGYVTKLSYQRQRLLFETIIAFGRIKK